MHVDESQLETPWLASGNWHRCRTCINYYHSGVWTVERFLSAGWLVRRTDGRVSAWRVNNDKTIVGAAVVKQEIAARSWLVLDTSNIFNTWLQNYCMWYILNYISWALECITHAGRKFLSVNAFLYCSTA